MTTEEKALALVNAVRAWEGYDPCDFWSKAAWTQLYSALLAAIEAHEADKKAFSDAVVHCRRCSDAEAWTRIKFELEPFILPEPDPLVEAMKESQRFVIRNEDVDALRDALAARGYKIERIEQ